MCVSPWAGVDCLWPSRRLSCFYNQRQAAFEAAAMPLGFICEARLYPTWLFLELAGKEIRPDSVPSNQGARMASTF